ncbi:hypothetical protein GCM10022243_25900 [Saccharothrix violaceirubra]|uniref:histidine kinase n=1 Tax=Saccharothrix violaceirubra TaxID=413306 RepID=A0A7W7WXK6_9PSEU|nr:sensor histidine kinase [Saccharothrix violaceirubra]MBB4967217.1 signal transduction histidine kinase [Saccharothrix violaceirubra]
MVVLSAIVLVGVVYVVAGAYAYRVQPHNRIGPLMVLIGIGWFLDFTVDQTVSYPLRLSAATWPALLGHVLVAFPSGRLRTTPRRLAVGAGYLEAVLLTGIKSFAPADSPWAHAADVTETPMTLTVGGVMLALLIAQWRVASPAQRRTLTSMLGASAVAITFFGAWEPVGFADDMSSVLIMTVSMIGMPAAYLAGLLRRRMDRGKVADLVVRLSDDRHPATVREALADALHDPGLRIGYWVAEQDRYVDESGADLEPAAPHVRTRVDRAGRPVAVLLHDPVLDPDLVRAACAAVALALENERLTAELRARLRQLADSRHRVLLAAETERRRLERDLHDGVQQRLLSVAMTLGLAESLPPERGPALAAEAKTSVLATIDDLRALCTGLHPPVLTERGLRGAVRELAALARQVEVDFDVDTPLPPQVETTAYYVVAEALANVTKHAEATRTRIGITGRDGVLLVRVDDDGRGGADPTAGSGLRGLGDRVESVGGTMRVVSEPTGTSVRVELPCGS